MPTKNMNEHSSEKQGKEKYTSSYFLKKYLSMKSEKKYALPSKMTLSHF
jgi:hypothetical protein